MQVEMFQTMFEDLEDYCEATVVTSIDYTKAFNRMLFQECLLALKRKGASQPLLRLIGTSLTGRVMSVRVERS